MNLKSDIEVRNKKDVIEIWKDVKAIKVSIIGLIKEIKDKKENEMVAER